MAGPLTLIFQKKQDAIPDCVTGGLDTVAVRMPNHPVALRLLQLADLPIAAPSANLSGKPSPTAVAHVQHDLDGRIAAIVAGGNCTVGVESTVLDLSGETPVILRPGGVTKEQLEQVTGKPVRYAAPFASAEETPRAPGMKYTHYAPEAPVYICIRHTGRSSRKNFPSAKTPQRKSRCHAVGRNPAAAKEQR